jgi:hypothetical protein
VGIVALETVAIGDRLMSQLFSELGFLRRMAAIAKLGALDLEQIINRAAVCIMAGQAVAVFYGRVGFIGGKFRLQIAVTIITQRRYGIDKHLGIARSVRIMAANTSLPRFNRRMHTGLGQDSLNNIVALGAELVTLGDKLYGAIAAQTLVTGLAIFLGKWRVLILINQFRIIGGMRIMAGGAFGAADHIAAVSGLYFFDTGIVTGLTKLRDRLDEVVSLVGAVR